MAIGPGTGGRPRNRTALVVEPDPACAARIEKLLTASGVTCKLASDAEAGWKLFAGEPPDVVFTALATPRRDGVWLLRRMREDYLGALPPVWGLVDQTELGPDTRALELDGVLLRPLSGEALRSLAAGAPGAIPHHDATRQATRLRDLFDLTLLGDDMDAALTNFVDRVALNFRVADCVLWGPPHEHRWPKTRRPAGRPEERASLLYRCDLALIAGATMIAAEGGALGEDAGVAEHAPARSVLAVPLDAPGARALGALCLVDDGARNFSPDERDALNMIARRLARELAWRSAHDRLAEEYAHLRETAQRDPLLGVLTAGAFAEALQQEIARAGAVDPPAVAVLDVAELRTINDRHGHAAGDAVLAHVGQLAEHAMRPQDRVGRLGGDKIGLILPGLAVREAHARLDRLRVAIADAPVKQHGLDIAVRVRAGVTLADAGGTADDAIARANAALREAKRTRAHVFALLPGDEVTGERATGMQDVVAMDDLAAEPDLLPAGATLGGMYQILHEISRGAMGVVYRAEDLGLGRPVAIKVLRADLARDAELVTRFRDEAAMLAALRHENLVQVYAFGAREHDVYFVMELVEGEALSDLMQRADEAGEPFAVELVGSIVTQVAGALDAMHRAGAVHRDVKPSNILLDRARDRAVLVDVGVAKRRGGTGDAAGTPGFAAPESFTQGEEGPSTDVYGLATTTYMMLTNLAPFGGGDVTKVIRRQLGDRPALPSALREELAVAVDRVLLRALSPSPRDRYGGALEFSLALGQALSEPPDRGAVDPLAAGTAPGAGAFSRAKTNPARPADAVSVSQAVSAGTRRLHEPLVIEPGSAMAAGESRGALFRVAYRILGNRLGSAWVRRACEEDPGLAEVLRPTVAPLGWYPTERLVAVLRAVPAGVRDPRKVARELGRAAMTSTFARFFGADPASLSPSEVLGASVDYWSRYHSWGEVAVEGSPGLARVVISHTPREPLVCCLVEGALERIAELAGAAQAQARHTTCETQGAGACTYEVRWQHQ